MSAFTSKPRSLIANALWTSSFTLWSIVVSLVLTPFLLLHLGAQDYGILVFITSVGAFMSVLDLGVSETMIRFVSSSIARNDIEGARRIIGTAYALNACIGVIACGVLLLGAELVVRVLDVPVPQRAYTRELVRVAAFGVGLQFAGRTFEQALFALQRYDIHTKITLTQNTCYCIAVVFLVLSGYGLCAVLVCTFASALCAQAFFALAVRRHLPRLSLLPRPSRAGLREIASYGTTVALTQLMAVAWRESDRLLVGGFLGPVVVTSYNVPLGLVARLMDFVSRAGAVLFPRFSAMTDPAAITSLFLFSTWTMLGLSIALFVPLTVLIPDFLRLWISPEFADTSGRVAQLMAACCIVRGMAPPFWWLFMGSGRPHYVARMSAVGAVISIGVNVLCISRYGLLGAGYAFIWYPVWSCAGVIVAWRLFLGRRSLAPLARTVFLPVVLGFLCLVACLYARAHLAAPEIGWIGLLAWGGAFFAASACLVGGAEYVLGGSCNHARMLLQRLRVRLTPAPPDAVSPPPTL